MRRPLIGAFVIILGISGIQVGNAVGSNSPPPLHAVPAAQSGAVAADKSLAVTTGGGLVRTEPLISGPVAATLTVEVLGSYDIFLAGRTYPYSVHGRYGVDVAGPNSPQALRLSVPAGQAITVTTQYGVAPTAASPRAKDANGQVRSSIVGGTSEQGATHTGLSSLIAPAGSLVGVFLGAGINTGTAPPTLNFTGDKARNATTIKPLLNQVFFIGTGVTATRTKKRFIVPRGASWLYLGSFEHLGANHASHGTILAFVTGTTPARSPYQPLPTVTETPVPLTATDTPVPPTATTPPGSETATGTATGTATPLPTNTGFPSDTPSLTPPPTTTLVPTATVTQTPTQTPTQTWTPTLTPTSTVTATPTPTVTGTATPTPTWTPFAFPNPLGAPTSTGTATAIFF